MYHGAYSVAMSPCFCCCVLCDRVNVDSWSPLESIRFESVELHSGRYKSDKEEEREKEREREREKQVRKERSLNVESNYCMQKITSR